MAKWPARTIVTLKSIHPLGIFESWFKKNDQSQKIISKNSSVSSLFSYFHTASPYSRMHSNRKKAVSRPALCFQRQEIDVKQVTVFPVHIIMNKREAARPTAVFLISFKQHWSFMAKRDQASGTQTRRLLVGQLYCEPLSVRRDLLTL